MSPRINSPSKHLMTYVPNRRIAQFGLNREQIEAITHPVVYVSWGHVECVDWYLAMGPGVEAVSKLHTTEQLQNH